MATESNDKLVFLFCLGSFLSFWFIFFYMISNAGTNYYDLANTCVKNGGSWVHQSNYDGTCINTRSKDKV